MADEWPLRPVCGLPRQYLNRLENSKLEQTLREKADAGDMFRLWLISCLLCVRRYCDDQYKMVVGGHAWGQYLARRARPL